MSTPTQTEDKPSDEGRRAECMGRYKHKWQWVWVNGKMTDKAQCTTCGLTQIKTQTQA